MASELIVSVSGIRGIVGQSLTAEVACRFAMALGTHTQGGKIVLSRDGRPSGVMMRHAVLAGLLGAGCEVHDLDIVPTPTCGIAVRRLSAAGGIQITASHNPAEWNGLKLFGSDGAVLSPAEGKKVQEIFEARDFRTVSCAELGSVHDSGDHAEEWHPECVRQLLDRERIRARRFQVLLDANGGAGGYLGYKLLAALGATPFTIADNQDGNFRHPPEPLAENLQSILPLVPGMGADIGFALDPDADRLAIIDETGRYIGEELTLALAVQFRLGQERGPVVINMSTSRVVEDIAKKHGVPCHRSAVGEANVVALMREVGALIGGEGNGGVIDPRVGWVRDPFIGMGLVLNLMADTGKKLSELVAELPAYHIVKDKYEVPRERLPKLEKDLISRYTEAKVNRVDGLRLDWEDRWLHVRPSNTEPIVRVIAEAPRKADAEELCREVGALLGGD
jgi:phosphomannomutase